MGVPCCSKVCHTVDKYSNYSYWLKVYSDEFNIDDRSCCRSFGARIVIAIITVTEAVRLIGNIVKAVFESLAKLFLYLPAKCCERSEEEFPRTRKNSDPIPFQQHCITLGYERLEPKAIAEHCWNLFKGIVWNVPCILFSPNSAYNYQTRLFPVREHTKRNLLAGVSSDDDMETDDV